MASTELTLAKDVWTKVLENVTNSGQVCIIDLEEEPTAYLVALVNTGAAAPAVGFGGGIKFEGCFAPANDVASDYYVKPLDYAGKVVVLT
jgi:hypothetical protein